VRIEEKAEPRLCLVAPPWAYFTTQSVAEQDGPDWSRKDGVVDDPPYDPPYDPTPTDPWRIIRIAFSTGWPTETPTACPYGSYSVRLVNLGQVPWLNTARQQGKDVPRIHVYAGTTLSEFERIIRETGGKVYKEVP
jgi:hypothetical protein